MSIHYMNLAFKNGDLTGNKRLTLLALADNASDEGVCWPSYETIAKKINTTRRSAIRLIIELEREGYLIRKPRYKDDKQERTSNAFILNKTTMIKHLHRDWVVTPLSPRSDTSDTTVVTPLSPKPPIEPSVNKTVEEEATAELSKLYQDNLGMITPIAADWISEAVDTYPAHWFKPAFEEAVKNGVRTWNYIRAILERWNKEGFQADTRPKKGKPRRDYDKAIDEFLKMTGDNP